MQEAVPPQWVRSLHAWQQIHVNSPEDELRIPFSQLPKIGRDCVKRGVKAIQLVGWNKGGQDQGNPCHDPDPRLGGFEELKKAIGKIQEMGVKVILFAKFSRSFFADSSIHACLFLSLLLRFPSIPRSLCIFLAQTGQYLDMAEPGTYSTPHTVQCLAGNAVHRFVGVICNSPTKPMNL